MYMKTVSNEAEISNMLTKSLIWYNQSIDGQRIGRKVARDSTVGAGAEKIGSTDRH